MQADESVFLRRFRLSYSGINCAADAVRIMKDVIVIGAGASGLMAAYAAAKNGNKVTVIEKGVITVSFDGLEKKFQFPGAFQQGFLRETR